MGSLEGMRVGVLGPLEVECGARIVAIGGARMRAVLIRLALGAGTVVPVAALCESPVR